MTTERLESRLNYVSIGITSIGDEPIGDIIADAFARVAAASRDGRNINVDERTETKHVRIRVQKAEVWSKPAKRQRRPGTVPKKPRKL